MKKSANTRFLLSFLLIFTMLSPIAVLAKDGKKHFKEGIKAEVAEEWDKAAESFALAITENPRNAEYRLHYVRATFNASQMYIKKGNTLATEKDYQGAYNAFRRAYGYDPTNELARAEMDRMARLYKEANGINIDGTKEVKLVQTNYNAKNLPPNIVPPKLEELDAFGPFPGGIDLQKAIRDLAQSLDLNVIFDAETFRQPQKLNIELRGVTAAKALDYIFLQQNLFFQKIGPRTIMVANTNQRQRFQQLVLRTFYLANASPKDVETLIRTVIPAQPGRTPTIAIKDDATNSITIRDTAENIELMGQLIKSLDKDRAEVVMDVAIYEVSKSDLLQFGNQIGTGDQLTSIAATTRGVVTANTSQNLFRTAAGALIPQSMAVGLLVPSASLSAFQSKQNTKLLASTQIHAFNNEDSSARIGQRVPVTTASFAPISNPGGGTNNQNNFVGDVVNYEQVGLTLKFKPIVFPNQDVQVAMEIESKDVVACSTTTNNPCFSERTIKGTARVQNNKTLMLASVAQDTQTDSRSGLPIVGLIPIIGRLFTVPKKDNRQVDIIIAVTPRVIRAPSILPEDEVERPTGSLAVPTSGQLEAMIIQDDIDEQLANLRRLGNNSAVQLPDQKLDETPSYVRTNSTENPSKTDTKTPETVGLTQTSDASTNAVDIRPIDSSDVRTLSVTPTSDSSSESLLPKPVSLPLERTSLKVEPENVKNDGPSGEMRILGSLPEMKSGEKAKIAVLVKSGTAFRSAVLGLKFDSQKLAVRTVSYGEVFGDARAGSSETPYLNQNGKMYVSLSSAKGTVENMSGVLAFVEVEALADGLHQISLDSEVINLMTADGRDFVLRY